jgi:ribosomal protein L37AE/L43A
MGKKDKAKYTCPVCRERTKIKIVAGDWVVAKHLNERGSTCTFSGAKL